MILGLILVQILFSVGPYSFAICNAGYNFFPFSNKLSETLSPANATSLTCFNKSCLEKLRIVLNIVGVHKNVRIPLFSMIYTISLISKILLGKQIFAPEINGEKKLVIKPSDAAPISNIEVSQFVKPKTSFLESIVFNNPL